MPANNYKEPILVGSSVSEKRLSGTSRRHKNPHKVVHALDYFLDLDEADESFTAVKEFVRKVFSTTGPTSSSSSSSLQISRLKGGITNMLLQGTYSDGDITL